MSDLGQLVFALLAEESIGGACLHRLGLTMNVLARGSMGAAAAKSASLFLVEDAGVSDLDTDVASNQNELQAGPNWYTTVRDRAAVIAKRSPDGPSVSSEHLVIAMTEVDGFVKQILSQHGIHHVDVMEAFGRSEQPVESLNVDLTLSLDDDTEINEAVPSGMIQPPHNAPLHDASTLDSATSEVETACDVRDANQAGYERRVHALLDANLNRAREGLRVLEDCARFVLCCVSSTECLKTIRHQLVEAELRLRKRHPLIQLRDVEADTGTQITTANEQRRSNLKDIVTANCRRMQEAVRSLEEFGKLIDSSFSQSCKQLRYQTYQAEQMMESRLSLVETETDFDTAPNAASVKTKSVKTNRSKLRRLQLLNESKLYVLLTEKFCQQPWKQTAEAVLAAGADVLQLREKQLAKEQLRQRAAWLQDLCLEHDALFIVNDSAELAKQVGADGLHVGQTDLSVANARTVLNSDQLLGLSTHNLSQLQQAQSPDVDYVGVGPMFTTRTKSFEEYSGPAFAAEAAKHSTVPCFAIGGIENDNLPQLFDAGVRRIAVCNTVLGSASPGEAAGLLKLKLLEAGVTD